uniref:Zgc:172323 n=1 Tax=Hucho hucho TaxID=62062 RepID=A0A4W5PFH7_9TELE
MSFSLSSFICPSPTRQDAHTRSASFAHGGSGGGTVAHRTMSSRQRSGGTMCAGMEGGIDLDAATAENQAFLSTRSVERQEVVVLNDRLAVYIDKVQSLEQQNKQLEMEIKGLQNRFVKPSGLCLLYEQQLRELMKIADKMRVQRDLVLAAKEAMVDQLEMIKAKYEEALEKRNAAELEIEAFRPDVDAATSARIALEKQLEQLEVELKSLQRVQKQEIEELMAQVYSGHSSSQSSFAIPDLSAALKQIQSQYNEIAAKNLAEMDSWYKSKFEDITNKTTKHVDKALSVREEITNARKDFQNKERDLDALKTKNDALEAEINEAKERYKKELKNLQARIEALKLELKTTKEKIAHHLCEYQDLLNIKMALEIEITTYRKLIEGEDLACDISPNSLSLLARELNEETSQDRILETRSRVV